MHLWGGGSRSHGCFPRVCIFAVMALSSDGCSFPTLPQGTQLSFSGPSGARSGTSWPCPGSHPSSALPSYSTSRWDPSTPIDVACPHLGPIWALRCLASLPPVAPTTVPHGGSDSALPTQGSASQKPFHTTRLVLPELSSRGGKPEVVGTGLRRRMDVVGLVPWAQREG